MFTTKNYSALIVVIVFLMQSLSAIAKTSGALEQQREQYQQARQALAAGRINEFERIADGLRDYPLYPYLRYEKLSRGLRQASEKQVREFLDQYSYLPVAYRLRGSWLYTLKSRGHWQKFLQYYDNRKDAKLQCYAVHARIRNGEYETVLKDALELWMVDASQPAECDPVFAWLEEKNQITDSILWERIELAMERRRLRLARYLSKKLPDSEKPYFEVWDAVDRNPSSVTHDKRLQEDSEIVRKIVSYGIGRLARNSISDALGAWSSVKPNYQFTTDEIVRVDAYIALVAAQNHHPLASDLMQLLPENIHDTKIQQWRARAALRAEDWPAVLRSIVLMDDDTRQELEWRYWHARALEEIGIASDAKEIYQEVANERDYYGFLAADRMHTPYQLRNQPLSFVDTRIGELFEMPEFVRIRELYHVGQIYDAQREWNQLPGMLDAEQLAVAAYVAYQWGWYFNGIITMAKSGFYDDLQVRFPTPYDSLVEGVAKQFSIESAWVYGIMRQESAFNVEARSPVGASGLMQLMPATARQIAKAIKVPRPSRSSLLNPQRNVELGSAYLQQMLSRYNNHQVLATASYNAGPHRVKRWLPDAGEQMPADVWVGTIPFNETRNYVERVLAYTTVYEWKLSSHMTRLEQRMPPIKVP